MTEPIPIDGPMGDAIEQVLRPGPPLTGIRRLQAVDLLLGYGLGVDWKHGWWRQRALRLHGPRRYWPKDESDCMSGQRRDPLWIRLFELAPHAYGSGGWRGVKEWRGPHRALERRRLYVYWPLVRQRLEEETGYRALWTAAECADAAKIYADKPRSIGYRALMALLRTYVWTVVRPQAA